MSLAMCDFCLFAFVCLFVFLFFFAQPSYKCFEICSFSGARSKTTYTRQRSRPQVVASIRGPKGCPSKAVIEISLPELSKSSSKNQDYMSSLVEEAVGQTLKICNEHKFNSVAMPLIGSDSEGSVQAPIDISSRALIGAINLQLFEAARFVE